MNLATEPVFKEDLADFALTKNEVADLSAEGVSEMLDEELIAAIQTVADQVSPGRRFEYMDRRTLEVMTFLARRCCRNEGYGCVALV